MGTHDRLPFDSPEGKKFLETHLQRIEPPITVASFWNFHEYLKVAGLSTMVEVRTGYANKGGAGTTVYHDEKALLWVNIWFTANPWLDVIHYTGLGNIHLFPRLKSCWFRKNDVGGCGCPLTAATLETHMKYARLSVKIMDAEARATGN